MVCNLGYAGQAAHWGAAPVLQQPDYEPLALLLRLLARWPGLLEQRRRVLVLLPNLRVPGVGLRVLLRR
jgi:hypothetical protein